MKSQSRYGAWSALVLVAVVQVLAGCTTETEPPVFRNPFDPALGGDVAVPDSVTAAVGDNVIRLSWRLPEDGVADEFAIFRRQTDPAQDEGEHLLDRVASTEYTDSAVRNGHSYAYRVAAGYQGQFGARTAEITVQPGLFMIVIADDDAFTSRREVEVSYSGPGSQAIRLSEDPQQFRAPWFPASGVVPWTLSPDDGSKTVYAQFRLADGATSLPVFDTIVLDTRAVITSFDFSGNGTCQPGDVLHLRLVAQELHGSAYVTASGVFDFVTLFDDGTDGDLQANDGIYERDLIIPVSTQVRAVKVAGDFTDQAGNAATSATAPKLLTVLKAPDAVDLLEPLVAEPPDVPAITLHWSLSAAADFHAYRLFRSTAGSVDSTDRLVTTVTQAATLEFTDFDVVEGVTYRYRVYVQDSFGLETGSNAVAVPVPNLRPPEAVTVSPPQSMSASRIALEWDRSLAGDFAAYRIYRNDSGAVDDGSPQIAEITHIDDTYYDDAGLRENTAYYYRVYTVDLAGLSARSNEVTARTRNLAPPAVTLHEPTDVRSTSAYLSWGESDIHDFGVYRLYRDQVELVTTESTLVSELDQSSFTAYRDTELSPGTRYYYRLFVVDDASEPESTGSNTVTVLTPGAQRSAP